MVTKLQHKQTNVYIKRRLKKSEICALGKISYTDNIWVKIAFSYQHSPGILQQNNHLKVMFYVVVNRQL